jgi:SAM-dependent methyltransferase
VVAWIAGGDEGGRRADADSAGATMSTGATRALLRAGRAGLRGELPPRYRTDAWDARFLGEIEAAAVGAIDILDVGGGARPALAPERRPPDCSYIGLDVSARELEKAPAGSYDRRLVADVTRLQPGLHESFDLIVSWMVLEHVDSVDHALRNLRAYVRPGGRLIVQLAGAFSVAGIANRALPARLTRRLLERTQGRPRESVFEAHYDKCWDRALVRLLSGSWERWRVIPLYTGAYYFDFSPRLRALYLAYEELLVRRDWRDLAPYYLICATAPGGGGESSE